MRLREIASCAGLVSLLLVGTPSAEALTVPGNYPTIQAAINAVVSGAAPDWSVIEVQPGTYNEALLINTTSRSMTIRGAGAGVTIVNAAGRGVSAIRILRATGAIRIEGLSVRGGTGVPGTGGGFTFEDASPVVTNVIFENNSGMDAAGGVLTRSNAQFSGCTIRSNTATRFGGGLVIAGGSRPTFTNCVIRDNVSGTGSNIGSGGGVHINDASPTFRGCVITSNHSKFAGGGILAIGLFNSAYGPARLLLEDTEVSANDSSRFAAGDYPAEGGGIHIEDNTVAVLIRAHVFGNSANTGGGLNGYRARYEITSSVIEFNHAPDPAGVGGIGGGISLSSNNLAAPFQQASSLVLNDSVVRNNDARIGAGIWMSGDQVCGSGCNPASASRATVTINQSLIDSNSATIYGGGLRLDRADVTISTSHVFRNTVAASGSSFGGGLLLASGARATIQDTTIARNSAVNLGGGIFVDDSTVIDVTNSRIYANTAGSGGGIYVGNVGANSGTVQGSTIADNIGYQIHEQACPTSSRTILTYQNNTITPRPSQSDLYFSTCGGATTTAFAFDALPRTSGNTSGAPSFIAYLATPSVGPSVISWSVSRATSVTISGVVTSSGDTSTALVAPTTATTYSLTSNGGPAGPANRLVNAARVWGGPSDTALAGDFDGDGRKDLAVYRPATGQWFILGSSVGYQSYNWGSAALGDIPVPADYDGDGKTDVAIFRQATGEWFIRRSSNGTTLQRTWGAPSLGDVPVPADYDGDNKDDVGVYRQSSGQWYILRSSNGALMQMGWGSPWADTPVRGDYDGDGKDDIGVYRQSTAQWYIYRSLSNSLLQVNWGSPWADTPVPSDYDGDGKTDIAVARQLTGSWFMRLSSGGSTVQVLGYGDGRVPGDFDGNGRSELAIWQAASGSWLIVP